MEDVLTPAQAPVTVLSSDLKNYAASESMQMRVKTELLPLCDFVRNRKQPLNTLWQALFRVWSMQHDQRGYIGRSNLYIPAARKGVETLTSQLVDGTFPIEDPFSVTARAEVFAQTAPDVKAAIEWGLYKARLRGLMEDFYRSLLITGNVALKFGWRTQRLTQQMRGSVNEKFKDTAFFGKARVQGEYVVYDAPTVAMVDPQNLYVWPETAPHISEAEFVFEDLSTNFRALWSQAKSGKYLTSTCELLRSGEIADQKQTNEIARLQGQGIPAVATGDRAALPRVDITELWLNMDPTAARWEDEDPAKVVPCLVTMSTKSGTALRVIENPYPHKQAPYGVGRIGNVSGRFWGTGQVEAVRDLQVLLNDQTNQGTDCATYHLNPMMVMNPNLIVGDLSELEPGQTFMVNDINNAMKFDRPPGDLIQTSGILTQQTQGWIQDFIGAPPVLMGGSAPGRAFRSATGVGTAQRNATIPLTQIVRLVEHDVFDPMLSQLWMLFQEFATDDLLVKVGGKLKRIAPQELVGDYMFRWDASSQAQNAQVKGSQLTQLLGVLSAPNMQQLMQQNGLKLNPAPLIRKLYEEVFGFRDFDTVLLQQAMGAAGIQGAQPGGPGAPNLEAPRNTGVRLPEENVETNGQGQVQDDSGGFGAMRLDANAISRAMGVSNG